MNGSKIRAVIDTNVIFMALYNKESKAGKLIKFALENKIQLYSPDTVKEEITRVLKKELSITNNNINEILRNLPIIWIEKEIYEMAIIKTKVGHKSDKPIEALSLILNCGIISADNHFKNRINIDELLKELENQ